MTTLPEHQRNLVLALRGADVARCDALREAQFLMDTAEEESDRRIRGALEQFTAQQTEIALDGITAQLRDMITLARLTRGLPITDTREIPAAELAAVLKAELNGLIIETRNGEDPDGSSQVSGTG